MKNIILNDDAANNLVKEKLKNNEKFAVCRVGCGFETIVTNQILNGLQVTDQQLYFLSIQAGFYGNCLMDFYEEYSKGISAADFQVVWQGSMIDHLQENLFGKLSPYSEKISFKVVEPYYFDEPWSESLKNKKVLIINPFSQSIRYQYKKREKLWQNPNILPAFDLKTYTTVQSVGGKGPHSSWIESLNFMKDEISEIDFDIALLGCGSYGLPLVNFIKNKMNKTAIYVGGAVQIIFGIKGKRWDENQSINKFYNEFWKRPFDIETPDKASMVEGGCYW